MALSSPGEGAGALVNVDTFLTILYVMVDDFCKTSLPPDSHPGPQAALSRSATVTLAWGANQRCQAAWYRVVARPGRYRLAVKPIGAITGFGFGAASTKDQPLAEPFFALRRWPQPGLPSVGAPARGPYVVDKGFAGQGHHVVWRQTYGAQVLCPPKRNSKTPWPQALRRWRVSIRQIVETVYDKLLHTWRLGIGSGLMSSADFERVWRPRSPCTISVSG